jgi:predicted esterase
VWAYQRSIPGVREAAAALNLRFPGSTVEGVTPEDSGAYRKVTSSFRSDERGAELPTGRYLTLELEVGPEVACSSILRYDVMTVRNLPVNLEHTITLPGGETVGPDRLVRTLMPVTDEFDRTGSFRFRDPAFGPVRLQYSSWSPAKRYPKGSLGSSGMAASRPRACYPLIVWLHGAGEAGTDPLVALLGNPVTHLAHERVQSAFGGAFVLVPQCPTMWMDDGKGGYSSDGSSRYARALMALIVRFMHTNPSVDPDRVYIGGCSNGGYMAIRQLLDNPGFFAAGFPACEAFLDDWIGERELSSLARIPLRFVHCKADNTVPAGPYTERLYRRLAESGARDVDAFFPDAVVDPSGLYRAADGSPFAYHCHFSWVYALNDACVFSDGTPLMTWLARQRRETAG